MFPKPLPAWIDEAMRYRGMKEIPGKSHNPVILRWLRELKAWWSEDETPWCGTFVGWCLRKAGLPLPTYWMRAKAYADYGTLVPKTGTIPFGAIGVKSRKGGGHVFFIVGRSSDGRTLFGLGGNQSNMVNIVPFHIDEVDSIRWPGGNQLALPILTADQIGAANRGSEA